MTDALLEVDLAASYEHRPGALEDVRFSVAEGEIFGVAGPSGSGKSTLALALLGLLHLRGGTARGSVRFDGSQLVGMKERHWRALRGRHMAFVPQSPVSALNPSLTLDSHFREAWRAHSAEPWKQVRPFVRDSLRTMGLPEEESFLGRYPHQISVGQAQRVLIAMAVLHRPKLLIADEPTSALDPASQSGILDLFRRLRDDSGVAAVYISHDLASLASLANVVGILENGRMDRVGPPSELLPPPAVAAVFQP